AYSCGMRGVDDELWIFARFRVDIFHCLYKSVEVSPANGFRWFDQHGTLDDKRKINSHRVKSVIYQSFSDIERMNTRARLILMRENNFVHAVRIVRLVESVLQFFSNIACVQNSRFGRFLQTFRSVRVYVRKSAHHHSKISKESLNAADRFGKIVIEPEHIANLFDPRCRQKWSQGRRAKTWPAARTAATVRSREGFVKIQVDDIDTHVTWAGDAYERVHVRAIHIDQPARCVDRLAYLFDICFENADRVRIG